MHIYPQTGQPKQTYIHCEDRKPLYWFHVTEPDVMFGPQMRAELKVSQAQDIFKLFLPPIYLGKGPFQWLKKHSECVWRAHSPANIHHAR